MRFRGSVLFLQDMFSKYCRYTNVSFPYKVYEGFLREVQILPSGVRRISGGWVHYGVEGGFRSIECTKVQAAG